MKTSHLILALLALLLLGGGAYLFSQMGGSTEVDNDTPPVDTMPVEPDGGIGDGAQPLDELLDSVDERGPQSTIGASRGGAPLVAHHFGNGQNEVLLVANLHGGDAPNTKALADEMVTYFTENADAVPAGVTVTIIPTLNPDGLAAGSRFTDSDVDLNRNFDCDWAATSKWRDQDVSGGSAAFSEPEAAALRDYVAGNDIAAAIVWFAAEGKVYPSACNETPSDASKVMAATFATPAGYPTDIEFDAYTINGDMTNWLAKMDIPAISVLLSDRQGTELSKNQAGVMAVLETFAIDIDDMPVDPDDA